MQPEKDGGLDYYNDPLQLKNELSIIILLQLYHYIVLLRRAKLYR